MKDDRVYLEHILGSAEKIGRFVAPGRDVFFVDDMAQDAVVRNLEIIGEATKQLSEGTRAAHPDVPWRAIARMRDRLIHAYFGVDWNLVWLTATNDVPQLAARVTQILEGEEGRWSLQLSAGVERRVITFLPLAFSALSRVRGFEPYLRGPRENPRLRRTCERGRAERQAGRATEALLLSGSPRDVRV